MYADLLRRIEALEAALASMIRVGRVVATDPDRATVRVRMPDADGMVSYSLPVLFPKTKRDLWYAMPDIGDHVVCVFLPFGLEAGFVLGAFYSASDEPPVMSQDKSRVTFADGSYLEYDRAEHKFSVYIVGEMDLRVNGLLHQSADVLKLHADTLYKRDVNGYGFWLESLGGSSWHTTNYTDGAVVTSETVSIEPPEIP